LQPQTLPFEKLNLTKKEKRFSLFMKVLTDTNTVNKIPD
jgi:hypothetical protein